MSSPRARSSNEDSEAGTTSSSYRSVLPSDVDDSDEESSSDRSSASYTSAFTSPEVYDLAHNEELDNLIASWTISDMPRLAGEGSARDQSSRNTTLYAIGTHDQTNDWSEASQRQRTGDHVHAIQQRRKPAKTPACAVVSVGRPPGVCSVAEAMQRVKNVKRCVWQTYSAEVIASAAWQAAQEQRLVGTADGRPPTDAVLRPLDPQAPSPTSSKLADNPPTYYVVYVGRRPGIYDSALDSTLSWSGVKGASRESFDNWNIAQRKYQSAVTAGRVITKEMK